MVTLTNATIIFKAENLGTFRCVTVMSATLKIGADVLFQKVSVALLPTGITIKLPKLVRSFKTLPASTIVLNNTIDDVYYDGVELVDGILDMFPVETKEAIDGVKPTWNSFSWHWEQGEKAILSAQKWMKATSKVLLAAQKLIVSVRKITQTLNTFLSFYQDTLRMFVKTLASQIERLVTDVKSTGIYFLDMTTYHFYEKDDTIYTSGAFVGPWWEDADINDDTVKKAREKTISFLDSFEAGAKDTVDKVTKKSKNEMWKETLDSMFQYKMETYDEFIDRMCSHFTNTDDVVPYSLSETSTSILTDAKNWLDRSPWGTLAGHDNGLKSFRTGRPDFGPNGNMKIYIIACAFPDITKVFDFLTLLFGIDYNSESKTSGGLAGKLMSDSLKIAQQTVEVGNVFKKYYGNINELGSISAPVRKPQESHAVYPYWVGITAGNMFGPLFDYIDDLLSRLSSLSVNVDRGLLDAIEGILKAVYADIETLLAIINVINEILEYINMLLNIPTIAILSFDVQGGGYEVAQYIKSATGFFDNAVDDIKDVKKISQTFLDALNEQKTKYEYNVSKIAPDKAGTEYTTKYITEVFILWKTRYDIIKNIFNYCVQINLINKMINYDDQALRIAELTKTLQGLILSKQMLIDMSAPQNSIDEMTARITSTENMIDNIEQNNADFIEIWDEYFVNINSYYNQLIWPVGDTGLFIKSIELVDAQSQWDDFKKDMEKEKINYNLKIKEIIDSGYESINKGSDYTTFMINELQKQAVDIFSPENDKNKLFFFEEKLKTNIKDAQSYIVNTLDDKQDMIEDRIQMAPIFDRDIKRMFAGLVFVAGYPDLNSMEDVNSYFNFSDFNQNFQTEKKEHKDTWKKNKKDVSASWDNLKKFF